MFKIRDKNELKFYKIEKNDLTDAKVIFKCYINDYKSFIYTEKLTAPNEFTLEVYLNSVNNGHTNLEFFKTLINDNFDVKNNSFLIEDPNFPERSGVITKIESKVGKSGLDTIFTFKGFSFLYWYSTRIINPAQALNSEGNYDTNLTAIDSLTELHNFVKGGYKPAVAPGSVDVVDEKKLPFFENINFNITSNPTIANSSKMKTGLEIYQSLIQNLKSNNIIYSLESVINGDSIDFNFEQKMDKSLEVVFSNITRGNIDETTIDLDFGNEFNTAFVAGSGEGTSRLTYYLLGNKTQENFKELFVDSSESETTDELIATGESKLEETKSEVTISSKILESSDLKYGDNFKIGDKIKLIDELEVKHEETSDLVIDFSFEYVLPIEEVKHSYEGQYITTDITLGEPTTFQTNINKIEKENARVNSRK